MASRYNKHRAIQGTLPSGYEGESSSDLNLEPCGIEDVDRAFYELFSEKLPFYYRESKNSSEQRRVPVIFATGERFAIASKKEPLKDKNGALILPLISITRSGVEQDSTKSGGVSDRYNEMVIRKRLSPEDSLYQSLLNTGNFSNAEFSSAGLGSPQSFSISTGRYLEPSLKNNLFEIFVIPMPKYFTLKYEITIWGHYIQQVNEFLSTMMGAYPQPGNRTIRIDTKKGYWFVAYFDSTIAQENNYSDFTDSERITKATLTAEVPGYLILPQSPGIPNGIKSYVSAPNITFATDRNIDKNIGPNIQSGDEGSYVLSDFETEDSPNYPDAIAVPKNYISEAKVGAQRDGVLKGSIPSDLAATIGRTFDLKSYSRSIFWNTNPWNGKRENIIVNVVDSNASKGEEVLVIDVLESLRRS